MSTRVTLPGWSFGFLLPFMAADAVGDLRALMAGQSDVGAPLVGLFGVGLLWGLTRYHPPVEQA